MANIRDVAKATGYSVSTISRVINNYPYVKEEKRQHVLKVMDELNYIPNKTAQNLSHGETKNIGVIIPFTNHPYFDQLLNGIIREAFLHSYKITLLPTNYDQELEKIYLEQFAAKEFDGLIVTTKANPSDVFKPYLTYGTIVFCQNVSLDNVGSVYIDLASSIPEALHFMKEQGVKNLGVTLGRSKRISRNSKLIQKSCKEIFPDFDPNNIFWDCFVREDGVQAAAFFVEKEVDGILTIGDEVAAVILQHYSDALRPMIVGRENLLISEVMNFSTIDHHLDACGRKAFQLFYTKEITRIKLPYTLIKR
ncbi:LacI family transcriptional regulator [Enterococcus florum]|uniref:LacI family transcriptional regulator n=1 Tax=Enterococcus florum TaxID=2480627 RepID=A0A4P5PL84_9ENTE|nr:LacI family DNA-binding transcriptional regulator [Enterococcus florum]GCF94053.1 LacI family transcriptional regulator [Enterococcus florum]